MTDETRQSPAEIVSHGKCECGRSSGQCVKGDLDRCPTEDEVDDEEAAWPEECGMQGNGHCLLAGTEWCDWDCPIASEAAHNRAIERRSKKPAPLVEQLTKSQRTEGG